MNQKRVYNFSAGPAMLPLEVMQEAQAEFLNWQDSGMSVMEVSHRGDAFKALAKACEQDLRNLLQVPDNYEVLFLHGGARSQFAMVPMNLAYQAQSMAYVKTGIWSEIAAKEAEKYGKVHVVCDASSTDYTTIPNPATWEKFDDSTYLFYVDNETVNGVEFQNIPKSSLPLVSDMSSNLLTRCLDVSRFGIIFACAQKNLGPAGVTVVIVRKDLLQREIFPQTPNMFNYRLHAENDSMQNTSPTYPWYILSLVLKWVQKQGGLKAIEAQNLTKAQKLYDYIDHSTFYHNKVDKAYRSRMNVIFNLKNSALETQFLEAAEKAGLTNLKGHRFVGGLRASIYNAMPVAGIDALLNFMEDFSMKNQS